MVNAAAGKVLFNTKSVSKNSGYPSNFGEEAFGEGDGGRVAEGIWAGGGAR